jgi:hypothetical protein
VAAGALNKQIATDLGISEVTVKVYRANAMRKLRAKSIAELVRIAVRAEPLTAFPNEVSKTEGGGLPASVTRFPKQCSGPRRRTSGRLPESGGGDSPARYPCSAFDVRILGQ